MVEGGHGLGVGCAEEPGAPQPFRPEIGVHADQGASESGEQFLLAELKIFVIAWYVIAAIHQVLAVEMGAVDEIRVLDEHEEGEFVARFVGAIGR